MEHKMTVGDRLLNIREDRDETQEEVADAIGISHVTISRYETGQRMPKMDRLAKLAKHYGVTTDYLLGNHDETEKEEPADKGRLNDAVMALFDEAADLSPQEAEAARAFVLGLKANRKP